VGAVEIAEPAASYFRVVTLPTLNVEAADGTVTSSVLRWERTPVFAPPLRDRFRLLTSAVAPVHRFAIAVRVVTLILAGLIAIALFKTATGPTRRSRLRILLPASVVLVLLLMLAASS
jgi:hypothetical protein